MEKENYEIRWNKTRPDEHRIAKKFNPLWKRVAGAFSKECERCGQPRLYSIFDAYINDTNPDCFACSAAFQVGKSLINHVFGQTSLKEDDVKKMIADAFIRKSMLNVVRGIRRFGIRTPQPTAVPVVIVWNYTNRCNLNCIHCHQDSGEGGTGELTTKEAFTVIENIAQAGVSILTFSGGEPLLRSDIFRAIRNADKMGLLCTIASNGTLMTKPIVKRLKESGVKRVEIGLDGCKAETHDFLRNTPESFKSTIQGIKNCVEMGFDEICATMTLHAKNVNELQETLELAEKLGVQRFYLNRLIPAGRGKNVIDLEVSGKQRMDALEKIYEKFYESVIYNNGIQCYARGMTYYGRLGYERSAGEVFTVSEALSGFSRMWNEKFGTGISEIIKRHVAGFGGCSAGITYAGLTAGGDLLPCVPAPIRLGNLLDHELEDIWVNNKLLNYIRQRGKLKGRCGRCDFNFICGGCRYTAYVVKGDWLAEDPSCPYTQCTQKY